jgi:hypothetical protein
MVEKEVDICRSGVAWTRSADGLGLGSLLANLRGKVDAGTTEALEAGMLRKGAG